MFTSVGVATDTSDYLRRQKKKYDNVNTKRYKKHGEKHDMAGDETWRFQIRCPLGSPLPRDPSHHWREAYAQSMGTRAQMRTAKGKKEILRKEKLKLVETYALSCFD